MIDLSLGLIIRDGMGMVLCSISLTYVCMLRDSACVGRQKWWATSCVLGTWDMVGWQRDGGSA